MKKSLLIAALTLVSASAFASRARVQALQNAAHLSDVQDILPKPDQAAALPEFATIEFGTMNSAAATTTTTTTYAASPGTPIASGGFTRKMGNGALGLYLNNTDLTTNLYRGLCATAGVTCLSVENPLNLIYGMNTGDMTWGVGFLYSKSERKPDTVTSQKSQDVMGVALSASGKAGWDAQFATGFGSNAKVGSASGDTKFTGQGTYRLAGGYKMDTVYMYASYGQSGAKVETATGTVTADRKDSAISLGVVDTRKSDSTDFFYGISYNMITYKDDATIATTGFSTTYGAGVTKVDISTLPLIFGFESGVTSWMTLRGSVTQNVVIGNTKAVTTTATTQNDSNAASTIAAAGLGFKWGKFTADGTLRASTTGNFGSDASNFLGTTSFTYMF